MAINHPGPFQIRPAASTHDRAQFTEDGAFYGSGTSVAQRIERIRELHERQTRFWTNDALRLHIAAQPGLEVHPANRLDDLTFNTTANRFNHKANIEAWWNGWVVPNLLAKDVPFVLDLTGVMLGSWGLRLDVPLGRGNFRIVGGGTGGFFYNAFTALSGSGFSLCKIRALSGIHDKPGATKIHNIGWDGTTWIDTAPAVHKSQAVGGEQTHGPSIQNAKDVRFTNNLMVGFGDEGWETGDCDGVWTDVNRFENCLNQEWGDGGACSIKQGDRNWYGGTNFVRTVYPLGGATDSSVSAVNVKLVTAVDCENIHLGDWMLEDVNVGIAINTSSASVHGLTIGNVTLRGTGTRYALHRDGGLDPIGVYGFSMESLRIEGHCNRLLNLAGHVAKGRIGTVFAKRCTDLAGAVYIANAPDLQIGWLEVEECAGRAVLYADVASNTNVHIDGGRIGYGTLGAGYGVVTTSNAVIESASDRGHTIGSRLHIRATEHRGTRIISNLREFRGRIDAAATRTDASAATFGDGLYRIKRLIDARVTGDIRWATPTGGGQLVQGGEYTHLSGHFQGLFVLAASVRNRFLMVKINNPGQPAFGATTGSGHQVVGCDWTGCSTKGALGSGGGHAEAGNLGA